MDENKTAGNNDKKSKKDAVPLPEKITSKFGEFKAEFKKIVWPDKKSLVKHTATVIMTSLLVGAVIVVLDFAFGNAYSLFIKLLG